MIVDTTARGKPLFGGSDTGFNIVKFLLAIIAMIFDCIFLFQHFVLYRKAWEDDLKASARMDKIERIQQSFNDMNHAGKDGQRFLDSFDGKHKEPGVNPSTTHDASKESLKLDDPDTEE